MPRFTHWKRNSNERLKKNADRMRKRLEAAEKAAFKEKMLLRQERASEMQRALEEKRAENKRKASEQRALEKKRAENKQKAAEQRALENMARKMLSVLENELLLDDCHSGCWTSNDWEITY